MVPVANKVYLKRTNRFVQFVYKVLSFLGFMALLCIFVALVMLIPVLMIAALFQFVLGPLLGDISFIHF